MPGISKEGPLITTATAEVLLALEATRSLTGVSAHLAECHPHIYEVQGWDCHHVQQSETSSWPACYYCGARGLCKEYTSVPRPAHSSVTHSQVLIVLISHPLHLHMNEKSSQLVSYQVVRATIEAISKFTLLTLTFIPP